MMDQILFLYYSQSDLSSLFCLWNCRQELDLKLCIMIYVYYRYIIICFWNFFLTFRRVLMHSSGLLRLKCDCACYILCSDQWPVLLKQGIAGFAIGLAAMVSQRENWVFLCYNTFEVPWFTNSNLFMIVFYKFSSFKTFILLVIM